MKLLNHKPIQNEKWSFTIQINNKKICEIILKEEYNWPILIGQPINKVEKWLLKEYGFALNFLLKGIF